MRGDLVRCRRSIWRNQAPVGGRLWHRHCCVASRPQDSTRIGFTGVRSCLPLLRDYDRSKVVADVIEGVTVGLVALPPALAFVTSSGLTPQAGI